jgi:tetratricopeptide (TPR) repeat protein
MGWRDQALEDFDRAIQLKPMAADIFARGHLHQLMGHLDRAISDYSRAIQLAPNRPDYYAARGDAFKAKGESDLATADYDMQKQMRL